MMPTAEAVREAETKRAIREVLAAWAAGRPGVRLGDLDGEPVLESPDGRRTAWGATARPGGSLVDVWTVDLHRFGNGIRGELAGLFRHRGRDIGTVREDEPIREAVQRIILARLDGGHGGRPPTRG